MCQPSKRKLHLFFSFFVAAAIDSTNEANKVPLSSLLFLDVYDSQQIKEEVNSTMILPTLVFPGCNLQSIGNNIFNLHITKNVIIRF
jgi:hypothetical protein